MRYIMEEMGIQQQKALGYLTYGLGHVHKAMMEERHEDAELLVLRLIASSDQTCLDTSWRTSWPLTGLPEPSWNRWAQVDVGMLRRNYGASRLLHDDWVSAEVQRLKDVQYLIRQRPGNGGKGGKGEGKGGDQAAA